MRLRFDDRQMSEFGRLRRAEMVRQALAEEASVLGLGTVPQGTRTLARSLCETLPTDRPMAIRQLCRALLMLKVATTADPGYATVSRVLGDARHDPGTRIGLLLRHATFTMR